MIHAYAIIIAGNAEYNQVFHFVVSLSGWCPTGILALRGCGEGPGSPGELARNVEQIAIADEIHGLPSSIVVR